MTRAKDISKIITDADFSGTLDVAGAVTASGLTVEGSTAPTINIKSTDAVVVADDVVGAITFEESDATGGTGVQAFIKAIANDSGNTYDMSIGVGGNTEAIRVDQSGNVGIGTSSPDQLLHITGASGTTRMMFTRSNTADTGNSFGELNFENSVGTKLANIVAFSESGNTEAGIKFGVGLNASEAMRIDNNGALLIGKTSSDNTTVGGRFLADGFGSLVRDGNKCLVLNRKTSDGQIIDFQKDNTTVGSIGNTSGQSYFYIANDGGCGIAFGNTNAFPANGTGSLIDNAKDLGGGATRWDDVYATNGTIQTSDRNEKQDIEELSDAEQRVAVVAKGLMRKFRWIDSVAEKGDNARTHFGIIAQDLQDAFTAEGLDASDYAMFTSNTWWEKEISVDAVEADEENGIEAQDAYTYKKIAEEATEGYTERTRLGVRYNQLLAFIISAI